MDLKIMLFGLMTSAMGAMWIISTFMRVIRGMYGV